MNLYTTNNTKSILGYELWEIAVTIFYLVVGLSFNIGLFIIKKKRLDRENTALFKLYNELLLIEPDMLEQTALREEVIGDLHNDLIRSKLSDDKDKLNELI